MAKEFEPRLEFEELERRSRTKVGGMGKSLLHHRVFELTSKPISGRRREFLRAADGGGDERHAEEQALPGRSRSRFGRIWPKGEMGGFPMRSWTLIPSVMSSSEASLFPGYRHVETFGDDDEYERDENGNIIEEVEYVTLDLGVVEPTLVPSTSSYRLIVSTETCTYAQPSDIHIISQGLDTPTPFLQLSGTIFKGKHQTLLGTELLFTDAQGVAEFYQMRTALNSANGLRRSI